jgi:predicted ATP-dependent serine protease
MSGENKYEYVCPNCHAGHNADLGYCPECGFIGRLEHKVLRLTTTTAAGKLVLEGPPLKASGGKRQQCSTSNGGVLGYKCPRCGIRVSRSFGRCPDKNGCGYIGAMQRLTIQEREST